jgi:AmmeMemoRadiSam system protein B
MAEPIIKYPAVAGAFYPDEPEELRDMISKFLSDTKETKLDVRKFHEFTYSRDRHVGHLEGKLKALIVPHAGYIYSGPVAATGYKLLGQEAEKRAVSKIVLVGPSHHASFFGVAESGADFWETPLGKVKIWRIRKETGHRELITVIPQVHAPEHCLEVQLPFLQTVLKNEFIILPILTGEVSPLALAEALFGVIDKETVIIASSDLSHYNPYERAIRIDAIANKAVPALDIKTMEESGDACGKTAILTLMHIARKKGWKGELLDYRNSGDTAGSKDAVVGYGCYAFYEF